MCPPTHINGQLVEVVWCYKNLGTIVDNKLSFLRPTETQCMQKPISIYVLGVNSRASMSLSLKNKKKLDYIVRLCNKIAGVKFSELALTQGPRIEKSTGYCLWLKAPSKCRILIIHLVHMRPITQMKLPDMCLKLFCSSSRVLRVYSLTLTVSPFLIHVIKIL